MEQFCPRITGSREWIVASGKGIYWIAGERSICSSRRGLFAKGTEPGTIGLASAVKGIYPNCNCRLTDRFVLFLRSFRPRPETVVVLHPVSPFSSRSATNAAAVAAATATDAASQEIMKV